MGLGLVTVSFVKILTVFSTSPSNLGVRATCILAIAYALSYFILEILTWTLVELPGRRSIRDVPLENLLPVIRYVDPGNNPFTFPLQSAAVNPEIPLTNLAAPDIPQAEVQRFPWSKGVMYTVGTLGLSGPAVWMLLQSHIWNPLIGGVILVVSITVIIFLRLTTKFIHRRYFAEPSTTVNMEAAITESQARDPRNRAPLGNFRQRICAIKWIWRHLTTVNLLSATWIILLSFYFGRTFQDILSDDPVAKPNWMDWLG
jgi:hypothetical protein